MEKSFFRKLLNLAIVVLILHAGWKVGPVFFRHFTFKDRATEAARFSGQQPAAELKQRVLAIARREGVPIEAGALDVQRSGVVVRIEARYTENLEILPRYYYPYEFRVVIQTGLAGPVAPGDVR